MKNKHFLLVLTLSFLIIPMQRGYGVKPDYSAIKDDVMSLLNMKYKSTQDRFEISLSCDPEVIEESVDNPLFGTYKLVRYLCQSYDGGEVISVSRYPQSFLNIYDEEATVKGCFQGYEMGFNISIKITDYKIDGKVGKIGKFQANDMYWVAVAVFNKNRLYQIVKVGMNAYPSETEIKQFMSSFNTF